MSQDAAPPCAGDERAWRLPNTKCSSSSSGAAEHHEPFLGGAGIGIHPVTQSVRQIERQVGGKGSTAGLLSPRYAPALSPFSTSHRQLAKAAGEFARRQPHPRPH